VRALLLAVALAPAALAAPRDPRDVLRDHVAALGRAGSVRALSARGAVEPQRGGRIDGVLTRWRTPGELRRDYPFGRSDFVSAEGVFVRNGPLERYRPGQRTLRGGYYLLRALAQPFPLLAVAGDAEAAAGFRVGAAPGHEVLAAPADPHGVEALYFLDEKTHLLARVTFRLAGGEILATVAYGGFRDVNGVPLPHEIYVRAVLFQENDEQRRFSQVEWTWNERIAEWTVDPEAAIESVPPTPGQGGGAGFALASYPCGPDPHDVAAGDLDGDGATDFAAACEGGISVAFGGPTPAHLFVPLGQAHHSGLVAEDLDRDGRLELVTVSNVEPPEEIHVVSFGPGRTPETRSIYGAPANAQRLVVHDLDRDGLPDLLTTGGMICLFDVKFGNGSGGVRQRGTRRPHEPVGRRATGAAVGDVNGDGLDDIVVADGKQLALFQGNPSLGFVPTAHLDAAPGKPNPVAVLLVDLDGDGREEIVASDYRPFEDVGGGEVCVLRNTGSGFQGAGTFDGGVSVQSLATGNVDGDDHPDVVAASSATGEVVLLHGDGKCGFERIERFLCGRGPCRVVVADVSGDGRDDIVVSCRLDDRIAVLTNTGTFAAARRPAPPRAEACVAGGAEKFTLEGLSESYAFVREFRFPPRLKDPSGIAFFSGDAAYTQFVLVSDKESSIFRVTLDRNAKRLLLGPPIPLRGLERERLDLEAVAFDHESGSLFLGCEADSSVLRVTAFGHLLGRAKSDVAVGDNDGIEGLALRRRVDGTPLLYLFKERMGTTGAPPPVHVAAIAGEPLTLEPRAALKLPANPPDQTDAVFARGRFFVVSRLLRQVLEVPLDDDGFGKEAKHAPYAELSDRILGLVDARQPIFGLVEGIAIDHFSDLFLLVDHNGATIGVEGKNRGAEGRLLWLRNLSPPSAPAPPERVAVRQLVIGFDGSKPSVPGRTREQAKALAESLYARARKGEGFAALAREAYGDAAPPAETFQLVEDWVKGAPGEIRRAAVPEGVGRTAFSLAVGEIGLCEYHEDASPQGWRLLWRDAPPPDRVTVEHILVGVTHPRLPGLERTPEEARKIARELLERATKGEEFAMLRDKFSDDREKGSPSGRGPYRVCNHGVEPADEEEFPRRGMAKRFGDVAFSLAVGEVGIAAHDPRECPFGFHVIKRVK